MTEGARGALWLVVVLVCMLPAATRAEDREIRTFMPHYGYDVAYVATSGALYFTARYAITPREGDVAPFGGGAHAYLRPADVASDVTLGLVLYATPVIAFVLDGSRDRDYVRALRVPIVLVESFVMTGAVIGMLKNLGVCRPYAWQPETSTCADRSGLPGDLDEQRRSFPSGHAGTTASIGGALLGMWLLPSGRDDRLAPLALGATALSIATASLRVRAGAHSLTDVGVGLGVGFAVGIGTAALHSRGPAPRVSVAPTANGLVLYGAF